MADPNNSNHELATNEPDIIYREPASSEALTGPELESVIQRLGSLTLDGTTVLMEHQKDAFDDIVGFFREGGRETYVKLPTATGKTVLFVEICKRLVESTPVDEERPHAIVLVPTVDLVEQTVGSVDSDTGKRRGFKGFAPELDARALYGKMSSKQKDTNLVEAEVLVTTYNTFRNFITTLAETETITDEELRAETIEHHLQIEEAISARAPLISERQAFLKEAYLASLVTDARRKAVSILREKQRQRSPSVFEVTVLSKIIDIADAPHLNNAGKVNRLSRQMSGSLNNDRMVKALEKLDSNQSSDDPEYSDLEPSEEFSEELNSVVEEQLKSLKLTSFEQFAVRFIHKRRAHNPPRISDLPRRADRQKMYEYDDDIQDSYARERYAKQRVKAINRILNIRSSVARFGLVICDEAHRSIGSETWDAIRSYTQSKEMAILGLTATDEYADRNLEEYFEAKAHDLSKQEAMRRKIINPVALFVLDTGLRFSNVGIDATGDYDRLTISQMRFSHERNMAGVGLAKILSEQGYFGIMPAIPGDGGAHAIALARLMNQEEIVDPVDGLLRPMRARYVLGDTPRELRELYYHQLETKEIDWLTFIDVIREGWDSDRAKAMISMRPTRSPLLATQRLGRIGRTYDGAPVSIAIDLFDGIVGEDEQIEMPPVLAADVFDVDDVEQGYIVGGESNGSGSALAALRAKLPGRIRAHHNRYQESLLDAPEIDGTGKAVLGNHGYLAGTSWQTFEALQKRFQGFLPKELVLEAVNSETPTVRAVQGRKGVRILPLFSVEDIQALHRDKPEVNPWKLYIDESGRQRITPEGIIRMLSKRYPALRAEDVTDLIRSIEEDTGQAFDKTVGRVALTFREESLRRVGFTHMFIMDEIIERLVPYLQNR